MDYKEALRYIEQLNSKGISLGLGRIEELLGLLGNPQEGLRYIHVAGTNGKGSVCAFLDCVLRLAGLRVGRYISPTLYEYRERIQVNGEYISETALANLLTKIQQACVRMTEAGLGCPTVFEVETALAFLYFQEQHCDYVLLEVGMGGRLDSTNVIQQPVLSIITTISFDHTRMLGTTLAAIAREKGGIIKAYCPVVIGPQQPEALATLEKLCNVCHVQPVYVQESLMQIQQWSQTGQSFTYGNWSEVKIGLLGDYQCWNAAIALEALQVLQQQESALTDTVILAGMAAARWPGRFEVIHQHPLFVVDGAHNPAGAEALAQTIQRHFADKKVWLLLGVFRDKDYKQIAQIMGCCSDTIYCFTPDHERALDAAMLTEAVQPFYRQVINAQTAEKAVQQVLVQVETNDMIVSFGSLSTIKAVQEAVQQWEVQRGTC